MIGMVLCGGKAERMHGLPKFLLPIPGGFLLKRLCEQMRAACLIVDASPRTVEFVPRYGRVITLDSATMCEALIACNDTFHTNDECTLFGMPDTYWTDDQVFERLTSALSAGADVAVAVWRIRPDQRGKLGQCLIDGDNRIRSIVDKDADCPYEWAWGALAWKPSFWQHVRAEDKTVGIGLQRALERGLDVRAVRCDGTYYDCGTPDEYFKLIRDLTTEVAHATI